MDEPIFTYSTIDTEVTYNIKWSILKHIKYIINQLEIFKDIAPAGLNDNHFYDLLLPAFKYIPAFIVDYTGKRELPGRTSDLYIVRYSGRKNIVIDSDCGFDKNPESRRLLKVHDTLVYNLASLSGKSDLKMINFSSGSLDPVDGGISFSMNLLESILADWDQNDANQNSFEMSYEVLLNI